MCKFTNENSYIGLNERKYTLPLSAKNIFIVFLSFLLISNTACAQIESEKYQAIPKIEVGAAQFKKYESLIEDKNVALVANHTSVIDSVHLVDFLLNKGVKVVKVFSPEHGFRGTADAGEKVASDVDEKTGLPLVSLYGSNKKPTAEQLKGVDVLIFDIQDVGARFYTYISTMHYVMEAAAENDKTVLILDRPNPNGFYVDGPILEKEFSSFVGMHPVPVVHGMTVAEYATMINEEGWLKNGVKCRLEVVKCEHYVHSDYYELPIAPSPNLPNMAAIYLYPSLCFFEGTQVSVGRGTDKQFQVIGYPKYPDTTFSFTPKPNLGSKSPKFNGETCYGLDLTKFGATYFKFVKSLYLDWLILFYETYPNKAEFFRKDGFFNLLAGNNTLKAQIEAGSSAEEIAQSWGKELETFKQIRKKYLLYEDFE